ncbi:MAG: hypothetical protein V1895_03795 [Parcubacteria group bacterium]
MNKTLAKVAREVARVKRARVVVRMTDKGVVITHNVRSRISLIVVLGPATIEGERVNEALLVEIGVGYAQPYSRLYPLLKPINRCGVRRKDLRQQRLLFKLRPRRLNFARRTTAQGLSPEQYLAVAPYLFSAIQEVADASIRRWQSGPTARIWTGRSYFHRSSWKTGGGGVVRERD